MTAWAISKKRASCDEGRRWQSASAASYITGNKKFIGERAKKMKISVNQVQCKRCGSIITSEHSHDLKWCKCRGVAVDGGRDYLKRLTGDPPSEFVELSKWEK